jgi:hypothetical protein
VNDVVLAIYSDRLFMAAVGVYVLAMALHAAEYAALRSAHEPAAVPVAVGSTARRPTPRRRTGRAAGGRSAGPRRTWSCSPRCSSSGRSSPAGWPRTAGPGQHVRVHLCRLPCRSRDVAVVLRRVPALRAVTLFVCLS